MTKYSDRLSSRSKLDSRKLKEDQPIVVQKVVPKKSKNKAIPVSDSELDAVLAELSTKVVAHNEQEYIQEYLFLYTRLKALVRKAEAKAMETGYTREYYALCTLISQQREVIADIRAIADLSGQVQLILDKALQPMMSEIGQVIVNSFYQYRKLITETSKENEVRFALKKLDEITNEISKALHSQYELTAHKINDLLVGVPEQPKKKKK